MNRKTQSALLTSFLLLAGSGWLALAQAPPTPVRFTAVVDHQVRRSVVLPGSVASRRASIVASEVEGLVIGVDVDPGDRVRRGDALVRLRPRNFELQLDAAKGRLKEARARLELARSNLERNNRLFDDNILSQQERDDAFSEFTAWQGRVDQTEAEIGELELSLDRCVIRAPFNGVVTEKRTEEGQWIQRGGEVLRLVSLDRLEVRVDVSEGHYSSLRVGTPAEISFERLPDVLVRATVHSVIPAANFQARTFPVQIWIDDPDPRIGVGMLARVSLAVGDPFRATVVPKDALIRQGGQELLYRIAGDETVEPVPVTSRQAVGSWIVVEGPIAAGERVVTRGNERLQPGQAVAGEALEYALP